MTTWVYAASPIDQFTDGNNYLMLELEKQLLLVGHNIYRPRQAFTTAEGALPDSFIWEVNRHALLRSDVVVAWLPAGVPSIGVPIEIWDAITNGIPVVVITDIESWSLKGLTKQNKGFVDVVRTAEEAASLLVHKVFNRKRNTLKWKDVDGKGLSPKAGHYPGDVGFDLATSVETVVVPGRVTFVPCGVAIEIPAGMWGMTMGRSSTSRKHNIQVVSSVIDNGWRGEMGFLCTALGDSPVVVEEGQRVGQVVLMPLLTAGTEQVSDLSPTERDQEGFGSTGD